MPERLVELGDLGDRGHALIWYVDDLLDITPLRILDDLLPGQRAAIQSNSVTGHWQAAAAGLGIALLPHYVGRPDPRLVPVLPDAVVARRTYWLAVPREFARPDRVRTATAFLTDLVAHRRADLLGQAPD